MILDGRVVNAVLFWAEPASCFGYRINLLALILCGCDDVLNLLGLFLAENVSGDDDDDYTMGWRKYRYA